jgi:hypothetical protein
MARAKHRHKKFTPVAPGPLASQAALQADLKFSPEASALGQLLMQTRRDFRQQVRQERGIAGAVSRSAKKAIPGMQHDYSQALATQSGAQSRLDAQLAPLSSIADDIKAASAREAAGQRTRIGEAEASAVGELRSRRSQAQASAQYNIQNARREFVQNKGDIASKILEVARQRGEFTSATLGQLKQAQKDAALERRGQNLTFAGKKLTANESQRHNRTTEAQGAQKIALDRYKAKHPSSGSSSKDGPTRSQKVAAHGKFEEGLSLARELRKGGTIVKSGKKQKVDPASFQEIVTILTDKLGSGPLAKAAAQQAIYGGVGPKVRRRVHKRFGINVPKASHSERRTMHAGHQARHVADGIF